MTVIRSDRKRSPSVFWQTVKKSSLLRPPRPAAGNISSINSLSTRKIRKKRTAMITPATAVTPAERTPAAALNPEPVKAAIQAKIPRRRSNMRSPRLR